MPQSYRPLRFLFTHWSRSVAIVALCLPLFLCLTLRPAQGQTFNTLYHFTGFVAGSSADGAGPEAGLIMDGGGNLFGTTARGGANQEWGTIFELKCTSYNSTARSCQTYNATDTVLYSFTAYDGDAGMPEAGLIIDGAGNLFGTTTSGGADNNGTIFELKCSSYNVSAKTCQTYNSTDTVLSSITWSANNVEMPYSGLIMDGAGNLFEATGTGGASDNGSVIELACTSYDASSRSCATYSTTNIVLYSFTGSGGDGATPHATLSLDGAGNLFGTTQYGGISDGGTVFELACENYNTANRFCDTYSSTDTVLDNFAGGNGENPYAGLILDGVGNIFGTTAYGGATGNGTLFELSCASYDASAQSCAKYSSAEIVLYNFTGFGADGANPAADLILDGAGNLFGTTLYGGNNQAGTVFELACAAYSASSRSCQSYSSSDVVTDLGDFGGVESYATLILDGAGNLFGTTFGYLANAGTVFELSGAAIATGGGGGSTTPQTIAFPDPGTQTVGGNSVALNASASSGLPVNYASNSASVCTVSGGTATMVAAGACSITASQAGNGTYAAATPVTVRFGVNAMLPAQGKAFSSLYSFTASGGDGAGPYAALVLDGAGNLFGTTYGGGPGGGGAIFEITCTQYSASLASCERYSSTDTVLYDFAWSEGDGGAPYSGLFLDGAGNLLGTTVWGGAHGYGTVFELACTNFDSSTHSCATYSSADTVLYSFTGSAGDGAIPLAGLIMDGAGNLFGTTEGGGASGYGTIFELACASYSVTGRSCKSFRPADLVLYSVTESEGSGAVPEAALAEDGAGNLFGTTGDGGTLSSDGTIFELACKSYDTATQSCVNYSPTDIVLFGFNEQNNLGGGSPSAGLILDGAGNLFGTTEYIAGETGDLVELVCTSYSASTKSCSTYGSNYAELLSFNGLSNGGSSAAGLILDGAGNLYGTTVIGGDQGCDGGEGCGAIFKLTCTSYSTLTKSCAKYAASDTILYSFTGSGSDGAFPYSSLILDGGGNVFGTSSYAGASGYGTVFEESGAAIPVSGTTVQTIAFPNPGPQTVGGNFVALNASASSGLPVNYASNSPSVCTVNGGTATMVAAGACSITASQAGNSTYAAATPVTDSFTVSQPVSPSFTLTGTTVTVAPGATTGNASTITLTPVGGFAGSVSLTAAVTTSPAGAQYPPTLSFGSTSPVSITAGATPATATLTITTTPATTSFLSHPRRRPGVPWYSAGGAALACLLLFGLPTRRRCWHSIVRMLMLLAALTASVVACGGGGSGGGGGGGIAGTTAGNYIISVTGTSGTTTEAGTLTLTVQ